VRSLPRSRAFVFYSVKHRDHDAGGPRSAHFSRSACASFVVILDDRRDQHARRGAVLLDGQTFIFDNVHLRLGRRPRVVLGVGLLPAKFARNS
jgi:hypothetical protein